MDFSERSQGDMLLVNFSPLRGKTRSETKKVP